jgi:hypothetical protein
MAKQKQTFELATLESAKVVELDSFKEKQEQLVKEHPFVEITDRESYEHAKRNRTALKSGRTEIQNQDKTIGSVVSNFRKRTIQLAKDLIGITQPHEEKQQAEIDRWEKILEEERMAEQRKEEERVAKIEEAIEMFSLEFSSLVNRMTFETIDETKSRIDELINTNIEKDFEEFQPLFAEKIDENQERFETIKATLIDREETRVQSLMNERTLKIQSIELSLNNLIDNATIENEGLMDEIKNVLEDPELMFGDQRPNFDEMCGRVIKRAQAKQERLKVEKEQHDQLEALKSENERNARINEQRSRIQKMSQGYLDQIFQTDVNTFEEDLGKIESLLENRNGLEPEVEPEFDQMVKNVRRSMKQRRDQLVKEREDLKKEKDRQFKIRLNKLVKLGFDLREDDVKGFHMTFPFPQIRNDENWDDTFKQIQEDIEIQKKNNERQKRLEGDKINAIAKIQEFQAGFPNDYQFENGEMNIVWRGIKVSLNEWAEKTIESLKTL